MKFFALNVSERQVDISGSLSKISPCSFSHWLVRPTPLAKRRHVALATLRVTDRLATRHAQADEFVAAGSKDFTAPTKVQLCEV